MLESKKVTLRFMLLVREGVRLAVHSVDLVSDADCNCEGVIVVGVFNSALLPVYVPLMDSLKPMHLASSVFTRLSLSLGI